MKNCQRIKEYLTNKLLYTAIFSPIERQLRRSVRGRNLRFVKPKKMDLKEILEQLDSKFQSFHPTGEDWKYKKWRLQSWIYYGCDYGIDLIYYTDKGVWVIRQLLESGYVPGKELLKTADWDRIFEWTAVMAPTNHNYKTDRK